MIIVLERDFDFESFAWSTASMNSYVLICFVCLNTTFMTNESNSFQKKCKMYFFLSSVYKVSIFRFTLIKKDKNHSFKFAFIFRLTNKSDDDSTSNITQFISDTKRNSLNSSSNISSNFAIFAQSVFRFNHMTFAKHIKIAMNAIDLNQIEKNVYWDRRKIINEKKIENNSFSHKMSTSSFKFWCIASSSFTIVQIRSNVNIERDHAFRFWKMNLFDFVFAIVVMFEIVSSRIVFIFNFVSSLFQFMKSLSSSYIKFSMWISKTNLTIQMIKWKTTKIDLKKRVRDAKLWNDFSKFDVWIDRNDENFEFENENDVVVENEFVKNWTINQKTSKTWTKNRSRKWTKIDNNQDETREQFIRHRRFLVFVCRSFDTLNEWTSDVFSVFFSRILTLFENSFIDSCSIALSVLFYFALSAKWNTWNENDLFENMFVWNLSKRWRQNVDVYFLRRTRKFASRDKNKNQINFEIEIKSILK